MIYLVQLIRMLKTKDDVELFRGLFSDLDFELNEMGYADNPSELISGMLDNHFGLVVEDARQLKEVTRIILDTKLLTPALNIELLKRDSLV